jgi:hypothetical protein
MTYGATIFTASRDPKIEGFVTEKKWQSPLIFSGGGIPYVYNKSVAYDIVTLTWDYIAPADLTNLLAFLVTVNYSGNLFDFVDPEGNTYGAYFWGPNRLQWTPVDVAENPFSIQLLLIETRGRTMADYIAMTDVLTRAASYKRTLADSISLSDRMTWTLNGAYWIYPTDTITLSDSLTGKQESKARDDTISMSDTLVSAVLQYEFYVVDNFGNRITDDAAQKIIVTAPSP